ncbi:MAG: tape measure protein [Chthoniobacterales bacterium]
MSITADILITKYVLDDKQYVAGAQRVVAATREVEVAQKMAGGGTKTFASGVRSLGAASAGLSTVVTGVAAAYATLIAVMVGEGLNASPMAANFDALELALRGVEGSAKGAEAAMKRVKNLAREPGLGFQEATQGYLGLRRSGMSQGFSEQILRQFGNANALGGGGKDHLSRVLLAVQQMNTKPYLQGEELNQLTEAGIPAYKIMTDLFGTADTEDLKRNGVTSQQAIAAIVAQLEKLPRAGNGAKNSIENLSDAVAFARIEFGKALNNGLVPLADKLAEVISAASEGGVFRSIVTGADFEGLGGMIENAFVNSAALVQTMVGNLRQGAEFMAMIGAQIASMTGGVGKKLEDLGLTQEDPFMQTFNTNKRIIEMQMELGRKRAANDAKRAKLAGPSDALDKPDPLENAGIRYLSEIAHNTKQAVDLQKMTFGGGAIGQMGISPAERAGLVRGGGSDALLQQAAELIKRAIGVEMASTLGRRASGSRL